MLNTAIGKIKYTRAYGVCDWCGHTGALLTEALGMPSFGPSVEAAQKISHAAVTARSFEMVAEIQAREVESFSKDEKIAGIGLREGGLRRRDGLWVLHRSEDGRWQAYWKRRAQSRNRPGAERDK